VSLSLAETLIVVVISDVLWSKKYAGSVSNRISTDILYQPQVYLKSNTEIMKSFPNIHYGKDSWWQELYKDPKKWNRPAKTLSSK